MADKSSENDKLNENVESEYEEEEEDSECDSSSSSSAISPPPKKPKLTLPLPPSKINDAIVEQEEEEEDSSDSSSDSEEENVTVNPKPTPISASTVESKPYISTSPPPFTTEEKQSDDEQNEDEYPSSPSSSGFIIMPSNNNNNNINPPASASKVFCDEDEIALLKGLSQFWAAHGRGSQWAQFHLFVKDHLRHPFTKTQVSEKIRRLRLKFEKNLKSKAPLEFRDPHQALLFDLSKPLWGDEGEIQQNTTITENKKMKTKKRNAVMVSGNEEDAVVQGNESNKKSEGNKTNNDGVRIGIRDRKEDFQAAFPMVYASFIDNNTPHVIRDNFHLVGWEKAQEIESMWKEVNAEKVRLEVKRMELLARDHRDHLRHRQSK